VLVKELLTVVTSPYTYCCFSAFLQTLQNCGLCIVFRWYVTNWSDCCAQRRLCHCCHHCRNHCRPPCTKTTSFTFIQVSYNAAFM